MIIRLLAGIGCLLAVPGPFAAEAQERVDAACVSCLILHLPAEAVPAYALPRAALTGLAIALDAGTPGAGDALDRLTHAGAAPVLLITAGETPPPAEVFQRASVLLVRGVGAGDDALFALRTLTASARAERRDIRVLIEGVAIDDRIQPYVDGAAARGPDLASATVDTLVRLSNRAEPEPLVVSIANPGWDVLAAFARLRPVTSEIVASAPLTANEIVARHQARRARQDRLVRRTIARGQTTLLFEVPGFVAPVTVSAKTIIYRERDLTELEQLDIRVNGAAVAGGDSSSPPRLPLIEPERVATPPLVIALDDAYRYSLAGRASIDGDETYVIAFEPVGRALARGRAWIDTKTFSLRRLETVQSDLRGAIVSSEQHEQFGRFDLDGEDVWLPIETHVYQMYEGAGYRTPIHRAVETRDYSLNPDDFDAQLKAAHASSHLMLRDTPKGFRYLLRDPDAARDSAREVAAHAGERIRAAVFGILVDPNITVPLPFAGFSYVDLNLFNRGGQLNAFFGGTYGQLSWSVPSVAGTRWQVHGRAFAIAPRYNDRAFVDGIERYDRNIRQRPAHASAGVLRPIGGKVRARLDYELDYTAFDRADTTAAAFVIPANAIVHGFVGALEAESGPWSARAWWNPAVRQRWRAWGVTNESVEGTRSFDRYGASVARTLALRKAVAARVEAAWMGGRDLDRFSRYTVGAFDNRLHGYPTASIRYDYGAVARSVTSWAARGWRIDGFGDVAVVRDPGFGSRLRAYPGVGAAVELAGPMRTLWSAEWGYGFRARNDSGGFGTQSLRVTGVRVF